MKLSFVLMLVAATVVCGQEATGLRVMPLHDLVVHASLIARVRVDDVEKSKWGSYKQVVEMEVIDVVAGDKTQDEITVLAGSLAANTDDWYKEDEEWLVFLEFDSGYYRTVNYQYGRFRINGDTVTAWREADEQYSPRPYAEVREQIRQALIHAFEPSTAPPAAIAATPVEKPPTEKVVGRPKPANKQNTPRPR
jgi:hypothetical protein